MKTNKEDDSMSIWMTVVSALNAMKNIFRAIKTGVSLFFYCCSVGNKQGTWAYFMNAIKDSKYLLGFIRACL